MKKNNQTLAILFSLLLLGALITVFALEDVALTTSEENDPTIIQTDSKLVVEQGAPVTNSQEVLEESLEEQPEPVAIAPQEPMVETQPQLATIVGGKSIDDDSYTREYLRLRGFFGNLPLETVDKDNGAVFNAGNVPEDIKGFVINDKIYAIHLILCTEEHNSCYFRVNGVPTGQITTKDSDVNDAAKSFTLEEEYRLEVNSIQFNYCGTYRFCDMRHEAHDVVNVSIVNTNDE